MPTYDYVCGQCGHELELFQSITEAPKRKCPACGKSKLQRRIGGGAGFLFKGSGFYQTDYRSASYEASAKGEREGSAANDGKAAGDAAAKAPKGEEGSTGAQDSKPAASAESKPAPSPPKPAGGSKDKRAS